MHLTDEAAEAEKRNRIRPIKCSSAQYIREGRVLVECPGDLPPLPAEWMWFARVLSSAYCVWLTVYIFPVLLLCRHCIAVQWKTQTIVTSVLTVVIKWDDGNDNQASLFMLLFFILCSLTVCRWSCVFTRRPDIQQVKSQTTWRASWIRSSNAANYIASWQHWMLQCAQHFKQTLNKYTDYALFITFFSAPCEARSAYAIPPVS